MRFFICGSFRTTRVEIICSQSRLVVIATLREIRFKSKLAAQVHKTHAQHRRLRDVIDTPNECDASFVRRLQPQMNVVSQWSYSL